MTFIEFLNEYGVHSAAYLCMFVGGAFYASLSYRRKLKDLDDELTTALCERDMYRCERDRLLQEIKDMEQDSVKRED